MLIKRIVSFIIICVICGNVTLATTSKVADKPIVNEMVATRGGICPCTGGGYAEIVEQLMPAVVSITATKKQKNKKQQMPNYFSFKDLRDLMENLQPFLDNRMPSNNRNVFLFGSGFIIDASGIIVTNNHVIENADEITVKFHDDTTAQAKVLGRDHLTDIAVLKVEVRHALPCVVFGDSDKVRVGEEVLAIGNPIGLSGTVSAGIISARYRDIHAGPYDDFLQTDASLNQGSSGSPLFNMKGEVVGINTAIYSTSGGGNIGIGFAIPANSAASIVETLRAGSKVKRGYLGITVQEITDDIAQSLGDEELKGVLVSAVVKGSPAEKGGLKVGDIIREFNGVAVAKVREFSKSVAYSEVGKKMSLKIIRNNEPMTLQVKIGELDVDKQQQTSDNDEDGLSPESNDGAISLLGLTVRTITSEVRRDHGLSDSIKGVMVVSVEGGSYAESRGIRRYDVINQVNQRDIVNTDDLKRIIDTATEQKRKSVLARIVRNGQTVFIPIPLESKK